MDNLQIVISCNFKYFAISLVVIISAKLYSPLWSSTMERTSDLRGRGRKINDTKKSLLADLNYFTRISRFLEIINKSCFIYILKHFVIIRKICQSFIYFWKCSKIFAKYFTLNIRTTGPYNRHRSLDQSDPTFMRRSKSVLPVIYRKFCQHQKCCDFRSLLANKKKGTRTGDAGSSTFAIRQRMPGWPPY